MIFGVCATRFWQPEEVAAIRDLGVKWVRIDFNRASIETAPGVYDWSATDNFIAAMQAAGVQVLGMLTHTPIGSPWGSSGWLVGAQAFVAAAVERYKLGGLLSASQMWIYGVSHWTVFNEPNNPGFGWGNPGDDPMASVAAYGEALRSLSGAIKAADPTATVLIGGLSSAGAVDVWTRAFYQDTPGVGQSFDAMAYHPYGWSGSFPRAAAAINLFLTTFGDPGKPIWFDEFAGPGDALEQAWAQRASVAAVFWYSLTEPNGFGTALLDENYRPKPLYAVFKKLMQGGV